MPRFHFHTRDHNGIELDLDGIEFPSIEVAHEEALRTAREIITERVARGQIIDNNQFEITSEDGVILEIVPYRSALRMG